MNIFDRVLDAFAASPRDASAPPSDAGVAATAQLLAPVSRKVRAFRLCTLPKDGLLVCSEETQHWTPQGLHICTEETRIVFPSGLLARPEDVRVQCPLCGNGEIEVYQCTGCGVLCCTQCARIADIGAVPRICCVRCLHSLQQNWNVWEEHDRITGRTPSWRLSPPQGIPVPVSAKP